MDQNSNLRWNRGGRRHPMTHATSTASTRNGWTLVPMPVNAIHSWLYRTESNVGAAASTRINRVSGYTPGHGLLLRYDSGSPGFTVQTPRCKA